MTVFGKMSALVSAQEDPHGAPVVRLADLPSLAAKLGGQIRHAGFAPDIIVYIETGARLFAHEVAPVLGVPLAPLWVKRTGHGVKRLLAPAITRLPVSIRDWLRRLEEGSGVHRVTQRRAYMPGTTLVTGKRVLVLDDASDTGRTIKLARELMVERGAASDAVRTAVLAATTPAGRAAVDFYVLDRNCRMPWSTDSEERNLAVERAAQLTPADAPRDL